MIKDESINSKIGSTDISSVGTTITGAIANSSGILLYENTLPSSAYPGWSGGDIQIANISQYKKLVITFLRSQSTNGSKQNLVTLEFDLQIARDNPQSDCYFAATGVAAGDGLCGAVTRTFQVSFTNNKLTFDKGWSNFWFINSNVVGSYNSGFSSGGTYMIPFKIIGYTY